MPTGPVCYTAVCRGPGTEAHLHGEASRLCGTAVWWDPQPSMELKVWVDGVLRVVCGLSEDTTCQQVVIALAQAIGKLQ